jgi:exodeoxyribonuclease VII small subunit
VEQLTFEQGLEELKAIVQALEKGDLPLEESLLLFEKGVSLVAFCTRKLDEVEKKVELLVRDQGGLLGTRPFEPQDEA